MTVMSSREFANGFCFWVYIDGHQIGLTKAKVVMHGQHAATIQLECGLEVKENKIAPRFFHLVDGEKHTVAVTQLDRDGKEIGQWVTTDARATNYVAAEFDASSDKVTPERITFHCTKIRIP